MTPPIPPPREAPPPQLRDAPAGTPATGRPQEPLRLGAFLGLTLLTLVAGIVLGRESASMPLPTLNLFVIPVGALGAVLVARAIARWLGD